MEKGNSQEAIVNTNFNVAVGKEKLIEMFGSLVAKLQTGNLDGITPMVIGVKDGNIVAENCIVDENGNISLPDIKVNSKQDVATKSKFVRKILKEISPILHADIDNVTYVALMRKDAEKLQNMMIELKNGAKAKLENRVGCIWLIVGDYEMVI